MTAALGPEFQAAIRGAIRGAEFGEQLFGDDGDGVYTEDPSDLPGAIRWSDTTTFVPNPEGMRALLHNPIVVAAITKKAEAMADQANDMSITEGAEYIATVQNDPAYTRARARVRPANFKAMVDDAAHSTLLKTLGMNPSSPKP